MKSRPEALLEREVLRAVGQVPDLVLYRNEVGEGFPGVAARFIAEALADMPEAARRVREILVRHRIRFGLGKGSPDLVGAVSGRALGLELKAEHGRLRPEQDLWHAAARARGGFHVEVIRTPEEALDAIDRARRGEIQ